MALENRQVKLSGMLEKRLEGVRNKNYIFESEQVWGWLDAEENQTRGGEALDFWGIQIKRNIKKNSKNKSERGCLGTWN